jgi:hypothetical protein
LADALHDETLGLGSPWERGGLLLEAMEQFVGQGLAELERPANEAVERGDVGDRPPAAPGRSGAVMDVPNSPSTRAKGLE